jgi:thermitase
MNNRQMRKIIASLTSVSRVPASFVLMSVVLVSLVYGGLWPATAQELEGPHGHADVAGTQTPALVSRPSGVPGSAFDPSPPGRFKAGELLVKFNPDPASGDGESSVSADRLQIVTGMLDRYDATPVRTLNSGDVQLWNVPEGRELVTAEKLSADPRVEYAEPNYVYHATGVPNDPDLNKQWAHPLIGSPAAWDITTGGASFYIAIIDSGIDLDHPDLAGKIVSGSDFVDGGEPWDKNGHGTHVAGIAAAVTHNGIGVAGMDWQAQIMPVRVLDAEGRGWVSDITDGITWAYRNGAKVLNLSLVGLDHSQTMQDAVNSAHAAGSLVMAAMGNCRAFDPPDCPIGNPTHYPAAYDHVMAVAATTKTDTYAYYSQYGAHCDIAAPGGEIDYRGDRDAIFSTLPTYDDFYWRTDYGYSKDYGYSQGTSMAVPYVAGLATLVWAMKPSLTPDQVQGVIETAADDLGVPGWDPDFGYGRINALAALQELSADTYTLQEDDNLGFASPSNLYSGVASQFTVTDQVGGTWYYRVRAYNDVGNSPWSNIEVVTVKPAAPTLGPVDNTSNGDEYEVSWSSPPGATDYRLVEEADDPSFNNPRARYVGPATQYYVTGQPGGTWHYRVRAYNSAGASSWSETQSTTVNPPALEPPGLGEISNEDGDGNYLVNWTAVADADSYTLEESHTPYFGYPTEIYSGAELEFLVRDQPGGTWYYRVRALGLDGKSPWGKDRASTVIARFYLPLLARNLRTSIPDDGIGNGDFEGGPTVWTEFSSHGRTLIVASDFPHGVAPHSGRWAAWLGKDLKEIAHIEQQATVPAGQPYLVYWHWIDSEDWCGFDYGRVVIDGTEVDKYWLCASTGTAGWEQHAVDLGAYVGESVSLRIEAETDQSLTSYLFVDDVSFQANPLSGSDAHAYLLQEG